MSLAIPVDRFDYVSGAWLFWSEHHLGQFSDGYARLSRYQFNPGACFTGWPSLSDVAKDVYRAWCKKEQEVCTYDQLSCLLEDSDFDLEDPCVSYFVDYYGDDTLEDSSLINYNHSDFVNCNMCYTSDLLRFYNQHEDSILYWCDQYCEAIGATSRLEALAGETIETPDDFATALVNCGMTYLGRSILEYLEG